jgi:hypothetical protein
MKQIMKETTKLKLVMTIMLVTLTLTCSAQTENPRGIYKMMTIIGKAGEVKAPFDQYKICTDEVTLTLSMKQAGYFILHDNDKGKIFNYTGEQPTDENDQSIKIFDSDSHHFSMKWWSNFSNHLIFPENNWCTEKYEADKYSGVARPVFEALTATPSIDSSNPLLGTWRILGMLDELKGAKKQVKTLKANYETSKYVGEYLSIAPSSIVYVLVDKNSGGQVMKGGSKDKNSLTQNDQTRAIKWISKDIAAMEIRKENISNWQILERVTDGQTLLSRIVSSQTSNRNR